MLYICLIILVLITSKLYIFFACLQRKNADCLLAALYYLSALLMVCST